MDNTIPQNTPQKQCTRCKKWMDGTPLFFFRQTTSRDGLHTQCKTCIVKPRDPVPDGYKRCKKCGNVWLATLDFFYADNREPHGLRMPCKQCVKDYRKENKETVHESSRKASQKRREVNKRYKHEYYLTHKQTTIKAYREREKEERRKARVPRVLVTKEARRARDKESFHRRYKADPLRYIARVNKRKAMKRRAPGVHTGQQLKEQYKRQKGKCYYCQNKIRKGKNTWHADHVIPLSRGGSNDISNIVIACRTCNLKKQDKLPHEWPEGGRLL